MLEMMENCSRRRRTVGYGNEDCLDRFSELPDLVLSQIFTYLPTEDFARATLLSKRLKSLWSPLSILDLDYARFAESYIDNSNTKENILKRFAGFVQQMFALHQGQELEELRLVVDITDKVFGRVSPLVRFWVRGCKSFVSLKTLHLIGVRLSDDSVEDLTVKCPVLEYFHLEKCWVPKCFKFDASKSKLKVFVMELCRDLTAGEIWHILTFAPGLVKFKFVGNMPLKFDVHGDYLNEVELRFPNSISRYPWGQALVTQISNVHTLKVCDSFLKTISIGSLGNNVFTPLLNLKHLSLSTCCGDLELHGFAGLLMCSPYLETLSLELMPPFLSTAEGGKFCEILSGPIEYLHHHLKTIQLKCFLGLSRQMKYLSYMLKSALVLDKLVIEMDSTKLLKDDREKTIEKLLTFEKASPNVQFLFS